MWPALLIEPPDDQWLTLIQNCYLQLSNVLKPALLGLHIYDQFQISTLEQREWIIIPPGAK